MIVNRGDDAATAKITLSENEKMGWRYFDLFTGVEHNWNDGAIDIELEKQGFATLFGTSNPIT